MHLVPAALAALFLLAACGPPAPVTPVLSLQAGPAAVLAAPAALDAAGAAFVGTGTGGTGALAGLDGGLLDGSGAPGLRQTRTRQVGLRAGLRQALGPAGPGGGQLALEAGLELAAGQAGWHLPQGLGLLVDPMDLRVTTRTLAPELRLHWTRPLAGSTRLELFAGAGLAQVRSHVQARSALVALDHRSRQRLAYVTAGAGLRTAGARLDLQLQAARSGGAQARLTAGIAR